MSGHHRLPRRQFLRSGLSAAALILLPGGVALHGAAATERYLRLRLEPADARPFQRIAFGMVTDTHYGDFPDTDRPRFFRSSLANMSESSALFTDEHLDFAVHLGDVIQEAGNRPVSSRWLRAFDERFATFAGERHYVMGNHDLRDLTKAQFLNMTSGMYARNHYSFDRAGHRFIVLDANFRQDGRTYAADDFNYRDTWIPATQLDWLETQLEQARRIGRRAIIFAHQCFDETSRDSMIKNAPQVRALFERMGNVAAVFYGHRHAGGYFRINGIPYVGVVATVNGPDIAAAVVNIYDNGTIVVRGHGRQPSWAPFHAIDPQGNPLWP